MTIDEQRRLHAECAYWADRRAIAFADKAEYYHALAEYHRFKVAHPLAELELPKKPENSFDKY